jgi:hypothetical protein
LFCLWLLNVNFVYRSASLGPVGCTVALSGLLAVAA